MNIDPGRQRCDDLTLIKVIVNDQRPYAQLKCKCGKSVRMTLSKWRLNPPSRCIKCSVRRNRIVGAGLHKLRLEEGR
jgi:hypothetical protein